MNFLSSHPSVGGTVDWDGLQLQARTAPGSGRCLHRCTLVLCPCIAAGGGTEYEQGTASEGYDRGTALIHNRAGYGKGTDGGTKTIGGVRQSGIAPYKKALAHCTRPSANTKPSISSSLLSNGATKGTKYCGWDDMKHTSFQTWEGLPRSVDAS